MPARSMLAFALCATALASPVLAADLDQPVLVDQAPEYTPVEVGNGWYLRGDVGYQVNEAYGDGNRHFGSIWSAGPFSFDEDETPFTGSLGVGYHFTDYLRSDLNVGYIAGNDGDLHYDNGFVKASGDSSNEAWYGMANVYVDLGTFAGFTPYVGAGAGLFYSTYDGHSWVRKDTDRLGVSTEDNDYSFAYTLDAGLAYHMTDNLSVDVGYQFLSAPNAEYAKVRNFEDHPTAEGLDFHQVRIGLRYDLW